VIASGGASVTGPLQVDYTIGEIATQTVTAADKVFTQGFQQPLYIVILAIMYSPISSFTPTLHKALRSPDSYYLRRKH